MGERRSEDVVSEECYTEDVEDVEECWYYT
jgi:hypothetical protein